MRPLVGRERELARLDALLADSGALMLDDECIAGLQKALRATPRLRKVLGKLLR